jgi:hypothetical protein
MWRSDLPSTLNAWRKAEAILCRPWPGAKATLRRASSFSGRAEDLAEVGDGLEELQPAQVGDGQQ